MRTMTFQINDKTIGNSPAVWVTIAENADGTLSFSITERGGIVGDLRGFFFDVADESLVGTLSVAPTSAGFSELRQGNDSVTDLGNGANMNGLLGTEHASKKVAGAEGNGYDAGIEIGTAGIGKDDYQSFSFTLSSSVRALTLDDFAGVDFGARLASVGLIGGCSDGRDDSAKLLEHTGSAIDARDDANSVKEDALPHTASGNVFANDAHLDTLHVVTAVNGSAGNLWTPIVGAYGALRLDAFGHYIYTLDNAKAAVQALAEGQQVTESFTYEARSWNELRSYSTDSATLSITILGANDGPSITSAAQAGVVVEDAEATPSPTDSLSAAGAIAFADVDLRDDHSAAFAASASNATALGAFALTSVSEAPGAAEGFVGWSYTLDNAAAQYLAEGQSVTEVFHVAVGDGHGGTASQDVTISIRGINDAAVLSSATVDLDETDVPLATGGTLAISDVDSPQTFLEQTDVAGDFGRFTIDAAGVWSYTANSAFDELNVGDTHTDTFDVQSADGTGTSVTVRIHGTLDSPFTAGDDTVDFNTLASGVFNPATFYDALSGNDVVYLPNAVAAATLGYDAANTFQAGDGADVIEGGDLDDSIYGGAGLDAVIIGGDGDDLLDGGDDGEADTLSGGAGNDRLDRARPRRVRLRRRRGRRLEIGDDTPNVTLIGDAGTDRVVATADSHMIVLTNLNFSYQFGSASNPVFIAHGIEIFEADVIALTDVDATGEHQPRGARAEPFDHARLRRGARRSCAAGRARRQHLRHRGGELINGGAGNDSCRATAAMTRSTAGRAWTP